MQLLLSLFPRYPKTATATTVLLLAAMAMLFWRHPDVATRTHSVYRPMACPVDQDAKALIVRGYIFGLSNGPSPYFDRPCGDHAAMVNRYAILNALTFFLVPAAGGSCAFFFLSRFKRMTSKISGLNKFPRNRKGAGAEKLALEEAIRGMRTFGLLLLAFCALNLFASCGLSLEAFGTAFVLFAQATRFEPILMQWEAWGLALGLCVIGACPIGFAVAAMAKAEELTAQSYL